jgi:hypothetical protein
VKKIYNSCATIIDTKLSIEKSTNNFAGPYDVTYIGV